MRRVALGALGLVATVAILRAAVWLWLFFGPGGFLDGKAILAELQGLEFRHRSEILSTPQVFATSHKTGPILVVATSDRDYPYAWIAVTIGQCGEELCMVGGDAHLDIKCSDVDRLGAQINIAPPLATLLQKSCHADRSTKD